MKHFCDARIASLPLARSVAALLLLLNVIIAPAHGQITAANNWNSTSNTSWGVGANWTLGSVPNSANTMVQIGTAPRIGTIDLDATNYTIGNLTFHGLNQGSYTLQNGTLNINAATNNTFNAIIQASTNTQTINTALIISNSGTGVPSIRSVASGPLIINGNITFAGNASGEFFPDANAQITVNGNVNVGANELRFNGAGLLTLAGAVTGTPTTRLLGSGVMLLAKTNGPVFSNASGQLIVQNPSGTVRLGANNQIDRSFGFNGGTLDLNGFSNTTSLAVSLYNANSRVNFSGNGAEALSFGGMNNGATLTVTNFAAGVDTFRIGTTNLSGGLLAQFIFATANGNWTGTGGGGTWQAGRMGSFGLTNVTAQNDGSGYISPTNAYTTAISFGGTAETVTVSGTVQAGSLSFASGGFALQGGTIQLNGSGVAVTGANTIGSVIAGSNGLSKTGTGTLTLSGNNTYGGDTAVSAGALQLATSGSLRFVIGGSGTNNAVSGTGTTTMNGQFAFDLTGASTNTNATWTIVAGTLTNTYGTDFIVTDFNGNVASGLWTNTVNGVKYVFAQSNSVLSVQSNDVVPPYTAWVNYWQGLDPTFTNTAGNADPDGDGFDNDVEFAFDGNPTVGTPALMTATPVGSNAVFNWIQRTNDVGYTVQKNGTLTNEWTEAIGLTISDSTNQTGVLLAPTYVRKEFIITNATGKDFYRVTAVAP